MLPLNPENPRIIVPLFAPALGALAAQAAAAAAAPEADLVELRLDPLPVPDYAAALDLVRRVVAKPLIVTVRTAGEGGRAALDPAAYGAALTGLLARGGVDALAIERRWRRGCGTRPMPPGRRRCSASTTLRARPRWTPWNRR